MSPATHDRPAAQPPAGRDGGTGSAGQEGGGPHGGRRRCPDCRPRQTPEQGEQAGQQQTPCLSPSQVRGHSVTAEHSPPPSPFLTTSQGVVTSAAAAPAVLFVQEKSPGARQTGQTLQRQAPLVPGPQQ